MERSLLLVKPDAFEKVELIVEDLKNNGYIIVRSKYLTFNLPQAQQFYSEHEGKDFYNRLVKFMTGSMLAAIIVEKEHCVMALREFVGNTDPALAEVGTLRKTYGTKMPENAVHASADLTAVDREIRLIFGD
jgi:nucleoside-diphosphate kinase